MNIKNWLVIWGDINLLRIITTLMLALIVIFFLGILFSFFVTIYFIYRLLFGWFFFIGFIFSKIEINWAFITEFSICITLLGFIIHAVGKIINTSWKWQWTGIIIIVPLLLFIIALASIGLTQIFEYFFTNSVLDVSFGYD
jgi:hypothetical protein